MGNIKEKCEEFTFFFLRESVGTLSWLVSYGCVINDCCDGYIVCPTTSQIQISLDCKSV